MSLTKISADQTHLLVLGTWDALQVAKAFRNILISYIMSEALMFCLEGKAQALTEQKPQFQIFHSRGL